MLGQRSQYIAEAARVSGVPGTHCIKGILICIPVQKLSILFSLYYQKKENIVNVIQQSALKQNFQIKKNIKRSQLYYSLQKLKINYT